jgi:DNA-binding MarR family transcriptional regulator
MNNTEAQAWLSLLRTMQLLPTVLDAQLQRDSGMTHFEFMVLSMLQFEPTHLMRMTTLASVTNASLPRLSHVCSKLERRDMIERFPCAEDHRATNVRLTSGGRAALTRAISKHIDLVREIVIPPLNANELHVLTQIAGSINSAITRQKCPESATTD